MKISSRHLHAASSLLVAGTAASVLLVATISWSANFYRRLSELGDFSHRLHDLEAHDATLVAENEIVRRKVEPALGSFFIYEHAEIARRLLSPAVARATGDVRFRFTTPATPVETLPFTGNAVQLRARAHHTRRRRRVPQRPQRRQCSGNPRYRPSFECIRPVARSCSGNDVVWPLPDLPP